MYKKIILPKTYYISQGNESEDHLTNIKNVCEAGCKLVQLRLKNVEEGEYIQIARAALEICETYDALLIINDKVRVVLQSGAHGVHLGKEDIDPIEAREVLPEGTIIGGTANTLEDCKKLIAQNVDYIGLGPFRFTDTKSNLSPVISLNDYAQICAYVQTDSPNTPVFAIGGIVKEDVAYIFEEGAHGIAMSGALSTGNLVELSQTIAYCENLDATENAIQTNEDKGRTAE
ncbi:MAG: thiamine-phosphate pyrophosphorylase [Saprospiraceae bacterium]|jgi:thiamine-phosphate pyrophosphorylase